MVRALASHQCGPGSTPGPGVICGLSLLLVLVLALRGFSPGSPVFPSPQKPTFPNSNSIRNPRATGLSVPDCCVSPSLNKVDLLFIIIKKLRKKVTRDPRHGFLVWFRSVTKVKITDISACSGIIFHFPRCPDRFISDKSHSFSTRLFASDRL